MHFQKNLQFVPGNSVEGIDELRLSHSFDEILVMRDDQQLEVLLHFVTLSEPGIEIKPLDSTGKV